MSTPVRPQHQEGIITSKRMISPTVAHLTIKTKGALPKARAGQFCWVTMEKDGEKFRRPYSIASAPWEREIALCVKKVPQGRVSGHIVEAEEGTTMDIFSPLGIFTLPRHEHKKILLIATGTGVAPYRSMLRALFKKHYSGEGEDTAKEVTLLFGTKKEEEALYREEFEELAATHKNFDYLITLSREEKEGVRSGRVHAHLDECLQEPEETDVYICGLKDMVIEANHACQEKGVPRANIHEEIY